MKPRMFELAKKLSLKSTSKFKLGCVIANKNRIVCVGHNFMEKTHPKVPSIWKTLHAELHALIGTSSLDTKGCVAYVYRETKDGQLANAKPCPMCEAALRQAGVKKVYYTDIDGYKEYVLC
jgi:deoxycytidylate deaminase